MNAPAYMSTTETPAIGAYRMSMMLGGIRIPRVPPAHTTPLARALE